MTPIAYLKFAAQILRIQVCSKQSYFDLSSSGQLPFTNPVWVTDHVLKSLRVLTYMHTFHTHMGINDGVHSINQFMNYDATMRAHVDVYIPTIANSE